MKNKPYLLFDAGGTLVFPDQKFLIEIAQGYGLELDDARLFNGYYSLICSLDQQANKYGRFPCKPWPNGYAYSLLKTIGIQEPKARLLGEIANKRHKVKSLWTFTFNWVYAALTLLKREGYRMSVISNSDGRIGQVLKDLNLDCYFEQVFASHTLGIEKPDVAIFEIALDNLKVKATDAIYIGDVFEVDIKGANLAGVGAIHIDPLGLYSSFPGVHLENITWLHKWLSAYEYYPQILATDLFPCKKDNDLFLTTKYRNFNVPIDHISSHDNSLETYPTSSLPVGCF